MAQVTVQLPITKWAYADSGTPIGVIDISQEDSVLMKYFYGSTNNWHGSLLYVGWEEFPAALSKQKIYYVTAKFAYRFFVSPAAKYWLWYCDDFDPATLEWYNRPTPKGSYHPQVSVGGDGQFHDFLLQPPASSSAAVLSQGSCEMLRGTTGVITNMSSDDHNRGSGSAKLHTLADDVSIPYLEVTYDDAVTIPSKIVVSSAPDSGYVNPREATSFSWLYEKDRQDVYDCVGEEYGQTSAVFYWKDSESETYNSIAIADSTQSIDVPASTFPANKYIDWYVEGTDDGGTTSQTDVYQFSTIAGTAYATAQKPISTVEDGSAPITFEWGFSSEDGQDPSGVDLQWKLPTELDSEFHSLLSNASPVTSYSVAAGTFSAGEIQWRVRAYNVDGTAGPWSKPATGYYSFICISAPDPPAGLSATSVPLSTISWQSAEQQGYEITIDGEVAKKAFGAGTYRWTVEEPLSDGTHTISVRVLGAYGFWSQPSTVTINISNTPPATITLGGSYDADAYLAWTFDTDPGEVITTVYRDGEAIGKTPETTYVDMTVLGTHDYYVIVSDSSGNYSKSNTFTADMHTDVKIMAPIDRSAPWLELRLSENSMDTDEYQWTQTYATQHVTGAVYPQLDRSQYQDMTASYNCAFIKQEEIRAFESMKGKIVVLKCKGDHVVVGMLAQLQKRVTPFYTAYYFSIQQIHWY